MTLVKRGNFSRNHSFSLFGVPVTVFLRNEAHKFLESSLNEEVFHRISTVGPEFLLRARVDESFRRNLLKADMRVADGFGVTLAGWMHGKHIPRFPGADLLHDILAEAERRNISVFLAIRKGGLSSFEEIRTALLGKYPRLDVTGREFSVPADRQQSTIESAVILSNFGAPDQEYFLESLRGRSERVKLALGVGGAFDFLTGKLPRAPKVLRQCGLEWLWRFFLQPSRFLRIFRAVVVFPIAVLSDRLFKNT